MKNLLLIAIAILGFSTVSFGQAVSGTAASSATVLTPISITKTADLTFGSFAGGAGGTVSIAANLAGDRTGPGVTLYNVATTPVSSAKFTVNGDQNSTFSILLPADDVLSLTSGANSMKLKTFTSNLGPIGTLNTGTIQLIVGATLTVGATQPSGTYNGSFDVTVNYN